MVFTDQHIGEFRSQGYVHVPGFLTERELAAAGENIARYAPSAKELAESPERYSFFMQNPGLLQWDFPFAGAALNDISTRPDLLTFAGELLRSPDVILGQSVLWAKYGGASNFDQQLHLDYDENSLVYPRGDLDYEQLIAIVYYQDVMEDLGPTYVVPWQEDDGPSREMWPNYLSREEAPELYAREIPVLAEAGSLVVLSIRTFHRGSAIADRQAARFTHHLAFYSARFPWMGRYRQWPRFGTAAAMREFLVRASPQQRSAIGFPRPGDAYWDAETISGVEARYPGIDMSPYRPCGDGRA